MGALSVFRKGRCRFGGAGERGTRGHCNSMGDDRGVPPVGKGFRPLVTRREVVTGCPRAERIARERWNRIAARPLEVGQSSLSPRVGGPGATLTADPPPTFQLDLSRDRSSMSCERASRLVRTADPPGARRCLASASALAQGPSGMSLGPACQSPRKEKRHTLERLRGRGSEMRSGPYRDAFMAPKVPESVQQAYAPLFAAAPVLPFAE